MTRLGPSVDGSLATLLVIGVGVAALSFGTLSRQSAGTESIVAGTVGEVPGGSDAGPATAQGAVQSGVSAKPGQKTSTGGGRSPIASGAAATTACAAGRNGGATDRGVTATSIKLGATIVSSGIGASFLGPVRTGMTAVKDSVNRAGGICGRQLELKLVDDGWDAQLGYSYIRNLVEGDKVFALAVVPSSEGLRIASNEGYFAKTHTPVIGTDGMLNAQYVDPWVWPVAASTVSTMHIMAADAYNHRRARQFSIVYDSQYHFGVEGAYAFNAAVKRLTGSPIPGSENPGCGGRFCAIAAGKENYASENKTYMDACTSGGDSSKFCDFVALLLEPTEALTFTQAGFRRFPAGIGLAQTLFSRSFAKACESACDQAMAWTGYNPPIEALASQPKVSAYVQAVQGVDPTVDVFNQFLEGGYAGMQLVVAALQKAGPHLTRDGVATLMDSMTFDNGLSTPLTWRRGNHYANVSMQPFAIQYQGGFNGFRAVGGGWQKDPWVGQDTNGSGG